MMRPPVKINQRLAAFTLQEMVIVLVITSVLIGMAYFSYHAIHRYYRIYQLQSNEVLEAYRLMDLIETDLEQASTIEVQADKIVLQIDGGAISYSSDREVFIRNRVVDDSFRVRNEVVREYLEFFDLEK